MKKATLDVLGREITPQIGLIRVDNALQLPSGMIEAFRRDNQIDSSRTYHNVVLPLLIESESNTAKMNPEGKQYKDECARVMDKLLVHSPFGVVTCDVHTYLYRRDGYKNMKIKPVELKSHYQQVNRLYQNIVYAFYKEESVSKLAVRIYLSPCLSRKQSHAGMLVPLQAK